MKDVLYFDIMLTPKIITALYWLLLAGSVIGGIGSMFGFGGFTFGKLIMGLLYAVGGAVA